ncbi:MAG: type II toxin-antitoxin system MqsA family antitoxin [Actinomycetota bacterium]
MRHTIEGCPGTYERRLVALTLRYGGELIVLDNVPAEVCGTCGEELFSAETNEKIDRLLEEHERLMPRESAPVYEFAHG